MTNDQMKPGRFLRWQQALRTAAKIAAHLASGGKVVVETCNRATVYSRRHAGLFRATSSGLLVRNGRHWDCIDYCALRFILKPIAGACRQAPACSDQSQHTPD